MILPRFEYRKASSVEEALSWFKEFSGKAQYLSGGTDLVPRVKLGLVQPEVLIDLKGIEDLSVIEADDQWIRLGALARISDLMNHPLITENLPALRDSLKATSCETLQMRGAIGGNLLQNTRCLFYNQSDFWRNSKGFCLKMGGEQCNAVPGAGVCLANYCSDNAPALLTLSARIELEGPEGRRQIMLNHLYSGKGFQPFQLNPGEILTRILIPKTKTRGGYQKLRLRGAVDYPLLGVAMSSTNGVCRLAVGAMGPAPILFEEVSLKKESLDQIIQKARSASRPGPNTVVDAGYRKKMIGVFVQRLAQKLTEEAR